MRRSFLHGPRGALLALALGSTLVAARKCQNSVLDRPTRGKPAEQWGLTPQIAPLYGHHSA